MRRSLIESSIVIAALSLLLAHVAFAPTSAADEEDPHAHHRAMMKEPPATKRSIANYEIPNLTMVDQQGNKVPLRTLFDTDRPVMVNFIFTTCTAICPMMTSIFQQVQAALGDDAKEILMVSVSIDPEQDSPEALAEYAEAFRAGPQWSFLTGSLEDSIALQQAFRDYRGDKMNHAPVTLLRAGRESEWIRFDGFSNAKELAAQARELM